MQTIVMGHIPDALGARGEIARTDGARIELDTGLGNDVAEPKVKKSDVN